MLTASMHSRALNPSRRFIGLRGDQMDKILLVSQVMENLIRISKRRRYEFPKSTTGSRRDILDLFVQMCMQGPRYSC